MDKELKPCPFCGGKAEYFEERIYFVPFRNLPWKGVRCTRCGGLYLSTDIKTCPNDMRDAWNRRTVSVECNQFGNNAKFIAHVENLHL